MERREEKSGVWVGFGRKFWRRFWGWGKVEGNDCWGEWEGMESGKWGERVGVGRRRSGKRGVLMRVGGNAGGENVKIG